ncbi:MAG: fumarylacetoacetate hydrolase family protein [Gammaproteobacteria bacterium]|nr:fumarylacetoacetate hydrolase family protein [Gammaproteobacteria bacterium]
MKLASLKAGGRDGTLVVVDRRLERAAAAPQHATTLQDALDDWERVAPGLEAIHRALEDDPARGFPLEPEALAAPLPRAFQWLDASAYLSHIERARRARGAEMPPDLYRSPLMYQGGSDGFLGARDPIAALSEDWGVDFEAELAVITDDVPMGASAAHCAGRIRLLMLVNDVSLRNLVPGELAKGFGFVQAKPASACSPVAVTPDELGDAWDGERVHLAMRCHRNGELVGSPDAGSGMHFGFPELIAHAAATRRLGAGTIVGSGTVSNADPSAGCACLIEQRLLEQLERGAPETPFLGFGERVRIDMLDHRGQSVFGAIDQELIRAAPPG